MYYITRHLNEIKEAGSWVMVFQLSRKFPTYIYRNIAITDER